MRMQLKNRCAKAGAGYSCSLADGKVGYDMKRIWSRFQTILAVLLSFAFMLPNVCFAEDGVLSPYKTHKLPCTIEGVNFDKGGAGVAYNVMGDIVGTYKYREDAQMNFYADDYGVTIGYNAGEWMKYTVTAAQDMEYTVTALYATPSDGAEFEVSVDDETTVSAVLPSTGGWTDYGEAEIGKLYISKGKHVLCFKMLKNGITFKSVTFSVEEEDKKIIDFSRKTGAFRTVYVPARIQAEDFDMKGTAIDTKAARGYSADEGIDIVSSDTGYYIKLSNEQYVDYTYIVEQSGAYTLSFCASGNAKIYFDDIDSALTVSGDSMDSETKLISVWLEKGTHRLRVYPDGTLNMDYLRFESAKEDYIELSALSQTAEKSEKPEQTRIYREFYVSPNGSDSSDGSFSAPFRTISAAQQAVRNISENMDADIVVHILSGEYNIEKRLEFTAEDSGKNGFRVIYRGDNILDQPVISGGTRITGWEKTDDYIWKASAPIDAARTLYINGLPAQRARSKYVYVAEGYCSRGDSKYNEDGISLSEKNFPHISKPEDAELVWNLYWTCQRTPVTGMEYAGGRVNIFLAQPYYHNALTKDYEGTNPIAGNAFYIENARELLDEPGEFYFDSDEKAIYYYAFKDEDMQTADTYVGTTEFLVRAAGDNPQNKLENVSFENIDFKYGAWNGVSETGLIGVQSERLVAGANEIVSYGGTMLPAQFEVENAKNVTISGCRFQSLGSGALSMANGVSDSKIIGNQFTDISGYAIEAGHWDHVNTMPENMQRCTNIEIADNVIRRAAQEFRGSCAVTLFYVNSVNVHNNDIANVPYTGISLGWGWGEDIRECADNIIANNRIDDVNATTHDGAHIYTLGPMRDSAIIGNYLTNAGDWRGGIYLDEGTGYVTVSDNVVQNSAQCWFFARANVRIKQIYASDNFTDTDVMELDTANVEMVNTTVVNDGSWPDAALKIIENAGVSPQNKRLLSGTQLPQWRTDWIHTMPQNAFKSAYSSQYEAEDFIKGGEGVGYHKLNNEAVSIYDSGFENSVIGDTKPGEWLKYRFQVENSDIYTIKIKAANNFSAAEAIPKVKLYLDDKLIADSVEIPNNGSWTEHVWIDVTDTMIDAGEHTLKVEFANNGFSFDAWQLYNEKYEPEQGADDPDYDEGEIVTEESLKKTVFDDISGHWAERSILNMAERGIIYGIGDRVFAPEDKVSLYQSVWLALRAADIEYNSDDWKSIAAGYGLLEDENEQDKQIERQRFADIVMKIYVQKNKQYKLVWNPSVYTDFASIAEKYRNSVLGAKELGLMNGNPEGDFAPEKTLTRAEAAVVIDALINVL